MAYVPFILCLLTFIISADILMLNSFTVIKAADNNLKKGVFSVTTSSNSLIDQECLLSTKEFQSQHEKSCSKCSLSLTLYSVSTW